MSKQKVLVGMSGGVDSSVAAALLKEQGYEVIGATLRVRPEEGENGNREDALCPVVEVEDAIKTSEKLGIRHYVFDFRDIFREKVVNYFIDEYLKGRTPNPCIVCNRYVKFAALLEKAGSMGIDYIATGHYAIVEKNENTGRYLLKKSLHSDKDQTYALYKLTQQQLGRTLMPLGSREKAHVREIARSLGLEEADRPDSQEICFIKDGGYREYISQHSEAAPKEGFFTDTEGKILGRHLGIAHYTVGQRKGLGISFGKPMFVKEIDAAANKIVLAEERLMYSPGLIAGDLNFIPYDKLDSPMEVSVKIRYNAREVPALLNPIGTDEAEVIFKEPQKAVTPGQAAVFYEDRTVVGGGTIESVYRDRF
ncbi:MAG: tRNA 2-thiouridine(34) synthase MnmA [Eubacteriales bacterium]|nr:tRNA 2-thiouridine(34) synthase MnmA [Eubacteriales bacterium]